LRTRYFCLLFAAVVSAAVVLLTPSSSALLQAVWAAPGVVALVGAVFQLMRDQDAQLRAIDLQGLANGFHVAAQSHMAKAVFDKHIAFAEEYASAVMAAVDTLFRDGPTEKMTDISSLQEVRRKYLLWISSDLAGQLNSFQNALVEMGSSIRLWRSSEQRDTLPPDLIERAFAQFDALIGRTANEAPTGDMEARSYLHVLSTLQELLGVEALTELRRKAISAATSGPRSGA